ncbi:transcription termination/antitermination protein NusG [Adlercreutzia sp. ZJ141]|uniref:transcription termination/antitermination protein NusG n=1 Tax=Adlercreutzia sp. ZJ141 TaxID=2709406 RepID=UPI0013ECCF6C|nr:transcription termination/antitermination NusG family protein [Adlercreutzia sp. ZJ141]
MWFAINVRPGCEERALALLQERALPDGLEELFVPRVEVGAAREGSDPPEEPLAPGLLVAVAPGKREIRAALRHARGIDELLLDGPSAAEMEPGEVALLGALTCPGHRTVGFSEGLVGTGGAITVTSGPLCGRENLIRRVRHRGKRAYVRMSVAGQEVEAQVGLRVTCRRSTTGAVATG